MTGAPAVVLDAVRFDYEDMRMSFDGTVPAGALCAVIGPSGAGKSTLLNLVAGFERPLAGRILIGADDVTDAPPQARPVSMIFQDNNLFAHLDVATNVALGISSALRLTATDRARVEEALARVGLPQMTKRLPAELSGGERQRVAIARALVRNRPVLLLDEPFAALGPALRRDMIGLVQSLMAERPLTVLWVTHEPQDARRDATHTAYVAAGRIVAIEPSATLFADPARTPGLADYLGV
ncbi:MAG: thiamine ABC transporter ATP-binding protein [Hyphomicrobiales bacterium]